VIEVLAPGTMTTVQDWPGRVGLWHVGVPPSGPMDERSFRTGNRALGNEQGAPGLECTLIGPKLRFDAPVTAMICGAEAAPVLDGDPVPCWEPLQISAGAVLDVGRLAGVGLRVYMLFAGGLIAPGYLGSAATFTLGRFGGHEGRALRKGDVLRVASPVRHCPSVEAVPLERRPMLTGAWELAVSEGPHGDAEFMTAEDVEEFYRVIWEVHFNSARTGIRLVGPKPRWARSDGGEAGLHPSNIHDTPYTVGAVDFTGDVPIVLGPDGPSLGGFICPATVLGGDRWKLGQMRPGDTVRFRRSGFDRGANKAGAGAATDGGILARKEAETRSPAIVYRRQGKDHLLVELQPNVLDIGLRMRVHALARRLAETDVTGILELTEGIRALQVRIDPCEINLSEAIANVARVEAELPPADELQVPSRTVHLPLSWDDPATREATARYMSGVRADAPWCPWNLEFIRRVNGLETVDRVREIVYGAEYLVLGLGDVYLGAPVATPVDPRHRLVTTKYNPARTWTPENAVGIGGAYLCVYGMEGPGGYQFVGRTVQVWNRGPDGAGPFEPGVPWLLRNFDRIRWFPVGAEELLEMRERMAAGRLELEIEDGRFALAEHQAFLAREAEGISLFRERQGAAFAAERATWAGAGELAVTEGAA
jgi:urea carboxylase